MLNTGLGGPPGLGCTVTDAEQERIDAYLREHRLAARTTGIVALQGDASDRRYVRLLLNDGASLVLALHAAAVDFDSSPFMAVARLLHDMSLPVPAVLHYSSALGIIGLGDLGDVTLQAHVRTASAASRTACYRQAVRLIAQLQQRGVERVHEGTPPYSVAFDREKLTWELDFFVRHFIVAYLGKIPSEAVREALQEEWRRIVDELADEARVVCHRDYHSRNLMVHRGSLWIIDFQDARMGPDTYDLASLLRDSYVDLSGEEVDDLVGEFVHGQSGERGLDRDFHAEFRRRLDLMSLQRNLKALGTFGYQTSTRGTTVYVQYIPRTLGYVHANLAKYSRFARLREILASCVDGLAC